MKIRLAEYQRELLRTGRQYGTLMMLWRRQAGKTTTFAWQGLRWMLERPGSLVTFSTCSLALGSEMTEREVQMLGGIIATIRDGAAGAGKVESNADGLDWCDVAELYQRNRLEVSLWHDRTTRSRTKIIAASYATARGYSGYVLLDEVGFIRDFKSFYEAIEPVFSRNPEYRLWMATTPPEDDAHFSYELAAYPPGMEFKADARGTWYQNDSGMPIHRVSAADAELAGVRLYDSRTRKAIAPEEHRARSFDKAAWDRNYGLIFQSGGISAVQLLPLMQAQAKGAKLGCVYAEGELPKGWEDAAPEGAEATVGLDPATTEHEKSNPFGLAVTGVKDGEYAAWLLFRFRSSDPLRCKAILREVLDGLRRRRAVVRAVVIDATSERFWASEVKGMLEPGVHVELVVASERTEYLGEAMTMKSYLGNIAANAIADGQAALPAAREVKDDFRLVRRMKGGFDNAEDNSGGHGDMFDAFKNSIYGHIIDATDCEAAAAAVGARAAEPGWRRQPGRMAMRAEDEPEAGRATLKC